MREGEQFAGRFVRRVRGRDEVDFVEVEAALSGAGHGQMALVNGVKGAAEKRDLARARARAALLVGSGDAQRSSACDAAPVSAGERRFVQSRRRRNRLGRLQALESVGHAADQFGDAFAAGRGNGVKFQAALRAEIAKFFEARAIGGGVELGGHDDHRLFRQRRG